MAKELLNLIFCVNILSLLPHIHAGVTVWSNKNIEISPFKEFNNDALIELNDALDNPKMIVLQGNIDEFKNNLGHVIYNTQSSYAPNVNVNLENQTIMPVSEWHNIEKELNSRKEDNYLVLAMDHNRKKREVDQTTTDTTVETTETVNDPEAAIAYIDTSGTAMIYSARSPSLSIDEKNYILGKATSVTLDKRDTYTKMLVTIPFNGEKFVLCFKFLWSGGYWSLAYIEVQAKDRKVANLTNSDQMYASRGFSYHCQGIATFSSTDGNVTLQLFDAQIQPDAQNGKFGDVNDCVTFMTAPIWSGLFINFILTVVLFIGFGAIASIKTNDKFESNKGKQLIISASE